MNAINQTEACTMSNMLSSAALLFYIGCLDPEFLARAQLTKFACKSGMPVRIKRISTIISIATLPYK